MNRLERLLLLGALAGTVAALPLALVVAPPDAIQGQAQRLMYLHVPAAWGAYLCFTLVLGSSLWTLHGGAARARASGRAAAEVGVLLTAVTLASGSLWGALTWGTPWAWDARVASTVVMGLVYLGYVAADELTPRSRYRRVVVPIGIGGFAIVPVVHFSVVWWRTLHQPPTVFGPSTEPPLHPTMGLALAASVLTVTLLTAWLLHRRAWALLATAPEPAGASRTGAAARPSVPA